MDDRHDPSSLFFDEESLDLYSVLGLTSEAKPDELKKAYRRLALLYHPDKHATADEDAKNAASHRFQQIGFAYAVLGDEKRKKRYDSTGKTDEGFEEGIAEDGWEAYFEDLFDRVTKEKLDDMKKEYQGTPGFYESCSYLRRLFARLYRRISGPHKSLPRNRWIVGQDLDLHSPLHS